MLCAWLNHAFELRRFRVSFQYGERIQGQSTFHSLAVRFTQQPRSNIVQLGDDVEARRKLCADVVNGNPCGSV